MRLIFLRAVMDIDDGTFCDLLGCYIYGLNINVSNLYKPSI
jgi:hypothetical protein